jgi:2-dehydro-3-deoxygalactonokinase
MSTYITIDGGTTSTRVNLYRDGEILDTVKLSIGARASIDNREKYVSEIKAAVDKLVSKNNGNITRILASGMITSEFGLCNLPHITAPAGVDELHNSMHETVISEISDIPLVFMRGVKLAGKDIDSFDMMRGEETELVGIMREEYGECIYVLPGSHSKIIKTDKEGKIVSFSTMLTGEMIASLSQGTILKDAVDLNCEKINDEYLLKGYDYAEAAGINKALFKVRILKNNFNADKEAVYSFFIGVVLSPEIESIIRSKPTHVVIGGKAQIKAATATLLRAFSDKTVTVLSAEDVDASSARGVVRVYEWKP